MGVSSPEMLQAFTSNLQQAVNGDLTPAEAIQGIEAAYRADIDASPDPEAKLVEIETRLNRLRSPFRTAETFWVEEIIDPRDTRKLLCEFSRLAAPLLTPGPSTFSMRP